MARRPRQPARGLEGFSFADLIKWTDATKTNLIHWGSIGLIRPDVEGGAGRGHHRRFSPLNMIEVQLAATMNRLRVPTALIREGLRAFRDHHELCVAVRKSAVSASDPEVLTSLQRSAVERAYLKAFQRRDAMHGHKSTKTQIERYRYSIRNRDTKYRANLFSPEHQHLILHHTRAWYRFTEDPVFREEHPYWLFVIPGSGKDDEEDGYAEIGDEPLDWKKAIEHAAIVINLAPVIGFYVESLKLEIW